MPLVVTPQAIVALSAIIALSVVHLRSSGRIVHNLLAAAGPAAALDVFGSRSGLSLGTGIDGGTW